MWQEYFDRRSTEKGIWFRTIQPHVQKFPWIDGVSLKRSTLIIALRLRSGHIPSKKFGFLMKKIASPNCEYCGVIEDVEHILLECVRNETLRLTHFGNALTGNDVGVIIAALSVPHSDNAFLYCINWQLWL